MLVDWQEGEFYMRRTISKVTLIGLGAMGVYFAPRLQTYLGEGFRVMATGDRKKRLVEEGVTINGTVYKFPIVEPEKIGDEADLIIMAVKDLGLDQAIQDIKNQVGPNTQILCVMNGIDSENELIEAYGIEHVVHSFMRVSIVMTNGVANYDPGIGSIHFGEEKNTEGLTERVQAIAELFKKSEIPYFIDEDMVHAIWFKYMCNVGENLTCALLGIPFGAFRTSEHANFIRLAAMREVVSIANKLGVNLSEDDIQKQEAVVKNLPFANKPSTLQDLENQRKTEIEMFAGRVIELGKELGVATPINELFYHGIRTLEQKPFV